MAKTKKRKKVKKRTKGASRNPDAAKKGGGGGSGSMMNMRSGFKGVAGSLMGKESTNKKTKRTVDIFWWIVTIVLGAAAVYLLYDRFGR